MGRFHAVAPVQHPVADVGGEIELQARRVGLQRAVQVHRVRRFEEGAQDAAYLAVLVAHHAGLVLEPVDLQADVLGQALQVVHLQRETPLANLLGGALQVGEVVARAFLVGADQQLRELLAAGARLGEQFRQRCLQQFLGEQEGGLERHAFRAAALRPLRRAAVVIGVLVVEPGDIALEDARQQLDHVLGRLALAALDHAQIGDRGRRGRVHLHAARRELIERHAVALAQRAQLRAEQVAGAADRLHGTGRGAGCIRICRSVDPGAGGRTRGL